MRKSFQEQREDGGSRPTSMEELAAFPNEAASLAVEITLPLASVRNNALAALNFLDHQPPDLDEVREALGCLVADADRAGDIIDRIRDCIKKASAKAST